MARRWIRAGVAAAALVASTLLAGGAAAAGKDVTISGFAFGPSTVKVVIGDTVTWTNQDAAGHTVTGDGFDTGTIAGGSSASLTFTTAGTFAYACRIHPSMTGTVVVIDALSAITPRPVPRATTPPTDTAATGSGPAAPGGLAPLLALGALASVGVLASRPVAARVRVTRRDRRTRRR